MSVIPFETKEEHDAKQAKIQRDLEFAYEALNGTIGLISHCLTREAVISVLEQALQDFEDNT